MPDIIHSHMNAVGGIIAQVAKKFGVKHRIVHCHADIKYCGSLIQRVKSEVGLFIMKMFVNRYATDFWACSKPAARRLFYKSKSCVYHPDLVRRL